jgi:hypothetical protein
MAVTSRRETQPQHASYCPGCGRSVHGTRYCPDCGHAIPLPTRDADTPTTVIASHQVPAQAGRTSSRPVVFAAVGALGLAAIAVIAIIISTSSSAPTAPSYRQRLAATLGPVLSANQTVSDALVALDGSKRTITVAKAATVKAQSALGAARGSISVLVVPSRDQALAAQVSQALTQENGYLGVVAATLAQPTAQNSSQLRTLATETQSALVALTPVADGAQSSISGADNLISWATGAAAAAKHSTAASQQKAIQEAAQQAAKQATRPISTPRSSSPVARPVNPSGANGYVTPSGDPVPGTWADQPAPFATGIGTPYSWSGGQGCDQNIFAGDGTSCSLANNIFMVVAAASHYGSVLPATISVFNPDTATTEAVSCTEYTGTDNQTDLQCLTATGAGTAFPVWAANVYYR